MRALKIEKKLVKPLSEQEDDESRKIWKEVTYGLKTNDMEKATSGKCAIEQKQRDDVRYRKENNIVYQTKVRFFLKMPLIKTNQVIFFLPGI